MQRPKSKADSPIVSQNKEKIREAIISLSKMNMDFDAKEQAGLNYIANEARNPKASGEKLLGLLRSFNDAWFQSHPKVSINDINRDTSRYHSVRLSLAILNKIEELELKAAREATQPEKPFSVANHSKASPDGNTLEQQVEALANKFQLLNDAKRLTELITLQENIADPHGENKLKTFIDDTLNDMALEKNTILGELSGIAREIRSTHDLENLEDAYDRFNANIKKLEAYKEFFSENDEKRLETLVQKVQGDYENTKDAIISRESSRSNSPSPPSTPLTTDPQETSQNELSDDEIDAIRKMRHSP